MCDDERQYDTSDLRSVQWVDDGARNVLRIIDQRDLPGTLHYRDLTSVEDVIRAIKTLAIRGANSIGAAGAFGYGFAVRDGFSSDEAFEKVVSSRPTAVTLKYGVSQAAQAYAEKDNWHDAINAAIRILEMDADDCRRIGEVGAKELSDATNILTHCNTGILATAGIGTALGVIYTKHKQGGPLHVYATETRPLMQGLRLTAWELHHNGIDVVSLVDSAAPAAMQQGMVDAVIVGADRIALNGDTANKIGTYGLAVAAKANGVPFYVAAPLSAIDRSAISGRDIPIELRDGAEIFNIFDIDQSVQAWNPAFDITPGELITGLITPSGVLRQPFDRSIRKALSYASGNDSSGAVVDRDAKNSR